MTPVPHHAFPLGVLSEHPSPLESITFQLNGLVVVFLALSFIWAIMEIVGLYFKHKAAQEEAAAAAQASASDTSAIPPQLIAAIVAAVKVTLRDKRYKIHTISPNATDWAREGRRQIFASHSIR